MTSYADRLIEAGARAIRREIEQVSRMSVACSSAELDEFMSRACLTAFIAALMEPSGEMWSKGRDIFIREADKFNAQVTTAMAHAYADKSPIIIFRDMLSQLQRDLAAPESNNG